MDYRKEFENRIGRPAKLGLHTDLLDFKHFLLEQLDSLTQQLEEERGKTSAILRISLGILKQIDLNNLEITQNAVDRYRDRIHELSPSKLSPPPTNNRGE